jgi:hypothetical protein
MSGLLKGSQGVVRSVRAVDGILENQQLVDFLYSLQDQTTIELAEARKRFNELCQREWLVKEIIRWALGLKG